MLRACLWGLVMLLLAGCGARPAVSPGPVDLPSKPADFVDVFTWSQGVPAGARPISLTFSGPHFSYQFGALAVRPDMDETSGGLEGGPARAAAGHEFLVLYRLQGDDTFAPPPEAPLVAEVVVSGVRKRLPQALERGSALIVSVPIGGDATLEITDDKPYQLSIRSGLGATSAAPSSAGPSSDAAPKPGAGAVRWDDGKYSGQGAYQGQRTSGPLGVTLDLGTRSELAANLAGVGAAATKQVWLRLPDAKISTDDPDLKVDLARSVSLTLSTGTKISPRASSSGLLFSVPEPFSGGTLTIAPEFPASSTAEWSEKPDPKQIPLTVA
ncbi:hypothetical protein LWC34_39045 [Kibdelosporangium philippinense]|uniref:Lipoprotein n=1 Tax=Kibdelosporangium philippinense TaxID=211113 RepID=A0ABS8ZML8_9PSEU|nr:hypothetical protein [Kibdelosporangium philippinense]MCE7008767.1 hypothetical protein [Kibdelosporangium philippinense]